MLMELFKNQRKNILIIIGIASIVSLYSYFWWHEKVEREVHKKICENTVLEERKILKEKVTTYSLERLKDMGLSSDWAGDPCYEKRWGSMIEFHNK